MINDQVVVENTPEPDVGRLRPRWRKALLALHVAAAVGTFGAVLTLLVLMLAGRGGADPITVYPPGYRIETTIVVPLALTALATGILLGVLTPWGLLRRPWTIIKLIVTPILAALAIFVLSPRLDAVADAARLGVPVSERDQLVLVIAPAFAGLALAVNVVLGIYKPAGRARRRAAGPTGG
ncbi:MAG: hypothetical protein ACRDVZ_16605 [Jiangellaceae bacterium]